jgi:hypothetical protein
MHRVSRGSHKKERKNTHSLNPECLIGHTQLAGREPEQKGERSGDALPAQDAPQLNRWPQDSQHNPGLLGLRKCCFLPSKDRCLISQWKPLKIHFVAHCWKHAYFAPFTHSTRNIGECPPPFFDLAHMPSSYCLSTMQRLRRHEVPVVANL